MRKGIKRLSGYTLIEMLLVMAIIIILGSFGIGSYVGFRETMTAKENVETIKQDIQLTRQRAMNIKKGDDTNWLYGIGIDFRPYINPNQEDQRYIFFKWCSAFGEFGDPLTKGSLPGFVDGQNIGAKISDTRDINGCAGDYLNGVLPRCYSETCISDYPSLVEITGDSSDLLADLDMDQVEILRTLGSTPAFIFFEAITGRAIIYGENGYPINYELNNGQYTSSAEIPLDIALTRKRSSKFDLITIYPLSGAVVHHVYSEKDVSSTCSEDYGSDINCIKVDGKTYDRYTLFDEIKSYRLGEIWE